MRLLRFRLDKTAKGGTRVTRRYCNIACVWCHHDYFSHDGFYAIGNEDFAQAVNRIIRIAAATEAHVRLAGDGDPTVVGSYDLCDLIVRLKAIPLVTKVKMTTNGVLLGKLAVALRKVGIDTITVSLNTLDREEYKRYAQYDYLEAVKSSILEAYEAGLELKINAIYWKYNSHEIDAFEHLSLSCGGMTIKFFDLLVHNTESQKYYLPLAHLEEQLLSRGATFIQKANPYAKRVYSLPSGAVFEVKIAGQQNNCPNLVCSARNICLEGCRHSIRVGLDGIMRPCGVRTDNTIDLFDPTISDEAVWQSLHSGGKVGYYPPVLQNQFIDSDLNIL